MNYDLFGNEIIAQSGVSSEEFSKADDELSKALGGLNDLRIYTNL